MLWEIRSNIWKSIPYYLDTFLFRWTIVIIPYIYNSWLLNREHFFTTLFLHDTLVTIRTIAGLRKLGKNWNKIAKEIPNKTAAQVKHYFHNHRKRLSLDDCLKNPLLIHVMSHLLSLVKLLVYTFFPFLYYYFTVSFSLHILLLLIMYKYLISA